MAAPINDWLAKTVEPALEPDLPICDPHHHFWDGRDDRVEPRYMLAELLGGHRQPAIASSPPCSSRPGPCTGPTRLWSCARWARWSSCRASPRSRPAGCTAGPKRPTASSATPTCTWVTTCGGCWKRCRRPAPTVSRAFATALAGTRTRRYPLSALTRCRTSWPATITGREPAGSRRDGPVAGRVAAAPAAAGELADFARAVPDLTIVLNHVGGLMRIGPYAANPDEVIGQLARRHCPPLPSVPTW